jgi:16S rRNA C967 or C1407 C5-methylase (RsmB/RsmF family)
MNNFESDVPNWFDYKDVYDRAFSTFNDNNHHIFVELGAYAGRSTVYMSKILNPNISFFTVDGWKHYPYKKFIANLKNNGVTNKHVTPIIADSSEASRLFDLESVDFVFVDANHSYEGVRRDILAWLPRMKKTGVIAGHDYHYSQLDVIKAVCDLFPVHNINLMSHSCYWIEIGQL